MKKTTKDALAAGELLVVDDACSDDPITITVSGSLPEKKTTGAAGYDLCSAIRKTILPGDRAIVPTGIRMRIPPGYEAQIRSRSGMASRYGVCVLNSPGTIDSDYRGEIKVVLHNAGQETYRVEVGDAVAQLVFAKLPAVVLEMGIVSENETNRGSGGFGSTGR